MTTHEKKHTEPAFTPPPAPDAAEVRGAPASSAPGARSPEEEVRSPEEALASESGVEQRVSTAALGESPRGPEEAETRRLEEAEAAKAIEPEVDGTKGDTRTEFRGSPR